MSWFEVDKKGLAKLVEGRGLHKVVGELISNAWDEASTSVEVGLNHLPTQRTLEVSVTDDAPDGFQDLADAYTLFAESKKKGDATKRGRFNLGEKLFLSVCKDACIRTTTGTITFNNKGRQKSSAVREAGSEITGRLHATKAQVSELVDFLKTLIAPIGIHTTVTITVHNTPNKQSFTIDARDGSQFWPTLQTLVADDEGILRPTQRKTTVYLIPPKPGEIASVYEMGIPVVETGDKYHYNVQQKVPLNSDRDNVTPAYLRTLRVDALNVVHKALEPGEASEPWVREAVSDERVETEAVETVMTHRFGAKRVIYDPSDPEANARATSKGYTVIAGRSLSSGEWDNVKRTGTARPAGQVTPTPKPFSANGRPLKELAPKDWDPHQKMFVSYAQSMARALLGFVVSVRLANDPQWKFIACYGQRELIVNARRLGHKWFHHNGSLTSWNKLLIHELAHEKVANHLSDDFHAECCNLGAKLTQWALESNACSMEGWW